MEEMKLLDILSDLSNDLIGINEAYDKVMFLIKEKRDKCDHSSQAWEGVPPKRICQKCGLDRTD